MGRYGDLEKPRVLDEPTCDIIIQYLCEGNYLGVALKAAGVTHQTFNHWENRWKAKDPKVPPAVVDFFEKVWRCQSISEIASLRAVKEGDKNWSGNAWFLERRFPQRWGKEKIDPKDTESNLDKLNKMIDDMERDQKTRNTTQEGVEPQTGTSDSSSKVQG